MGTIIYVFMAVTMVFIFMKNFVLLKRFKHNKEYIACYRDVLNEVDGAYERINKYIDKENSEEYKSKARVLKLYVELKDNLDYTETLNSIDFKKIFYDKKDKLDKNLMTFNSDSFIFIMMAMSKAYSKNNTEVITNLSDKLIELKELDEYVEYYEVKAFRNCLLGIDDSGINFMNSLINGEYSELKYDKNMIGIYKRIAAACLSFKSQTIDDYFHEDLKNFVKTKIGKQVLADLNLYDKYSQTEQEAIEAEE